MSGNIWSRPNSKAYRDRFNETFGWKCKRCGTSNDPKAEACYDCKNPKSKNYEFCVHCGAGIGEHRREGEGTCPECDPTIPQGFYDNKFALMRARAEAEDEAAEDDFLASYEEEYEQLITAHLLRGDQYKAEVIRLQKIIDDRFAGLRKSMADDVPISDLHDDLRDHANWLWGKFIDRLREGGGPRSDFLSSADAYKEVFMAEFDDVSD